MAMNDGTINTIKSSIRSLAIQSTVFQDGSFFNRDNQ